MSMYDNSNPSPEEIRFWGENNDVISGWVSPTGDYYMCGYAQHNAASRAILNKYNPEVAIAYSYKDSQEYLYEWGWIRIGGFDGYPPTLIAEAKPTSAQLDTLLKVFYHLKVVNKEYADYVDKFITSNSYELK